MGCNIKVKEDNKYRYKDANNKDLNYINYKVKIHLLLHL